MLAGAAQRWLERFGVRVGERVVLVANGPAGLPAAAALRAAGARVDLVSPADSTWTSPEAGRVLRAAALSIRGGRKVREVRLRTPNGDEVGLPCDAVLLSGGMQPALQLWTQAGGRLRWSATSQALLPEGEVAGVLISGAAAGAHGEAAAVQSGLAAGRAAAATVKAGGATATGIFGGPGFACDGGIAIPPLRDGEAAFVDIHNDVTADDVALAQREGYRSIEHVKRYTTLGMGPDQGRTAARNGAVLADSAAAPTRVTTMRPPVRPVPLAAVAGGAPGRGRHPGARRPSPRGPSGRGCSLRIGSRLASARLLAARRGDDGRRRAARGDGGARARGRLRLLAAGQDRRARTRQRALPRLRVCRPALDAEAMAARYALLLRVDGRILDDGVVIRDRIASRALRA